MAKRPSKYRVPVTGSLEDAISAFYSGCQDLRDELSDTLDNMEEKFSQTSRYQALEETRDAIDGFCDDEAEVPDAPEGVDVLGRGSWVEFTHPRASRRDRVDNAVGALDAAISILEEADGKIEELLEAGQPSEGDVLDEDAQERVDALEEYKSALEELRDKLESDKSEAEGLEFPGMYG